MTAANNILCMITLQKDFKISPLNDNYRTQHHCCTLLSPKHSYVLDHVGPADNKISSVPEDKRQHLPDSHLNSHRPPSLKI